MYFLGPQLVKSFRPIGGHGQCPWPDLISNVWKFIIRPIAVGGMLVGAGYTLFKMRKNLMTALKDQSAMSRSRGQAKLPAGGKRLNIKLVCF
jgi:uncharacterized oligopeptide transporter (OPT) family protein